MLKYVYMQQKRQNQNKKGDKGRKNILFVFDYMVNLLDSVNVIYVEKMLHERRKIVGYIHSIFSYIQKLCLLFSSPSHSSFFMEML